MTALSSAAFGSRPLASRDVDGSTPQSGSWTSECLIAGLDAGRGESLGPRHSVPQLSASTAAVPALPPALSTEGPPTPGLRSPRPQGTLPFSPSLASQGPHGTLPVSPALQSPAPQVRRERLPEDVDALTLAEALPEVAVSTNGGRLPADEGSSDHYKWICDTSAPQYNAARKEGSAVTLAACRFGGYKLHGVWVSLPGIEEAITQTRLVRWRDLPVRRHTPAVTSAASAWIKHSGEQGIRVAIDQAAGSKVCLVNGASAYHVGGTFLDGGRHSTEEMLCMRSTLYPSLMAAQELAQQQRVTVPASVPASFGPGGVAWECYIPEDGVVLSPQVEIFRGDASIGYPFEARPVRLVAVVSVAMPNCNPMLTDIPVDRPIAEGQYREVLKQKFVALLGAAEAAGATSLVMPDVGCGIHMNRPSQVGRAFGEAVRASCPGSFKEIHVVGGNDFCEAAEAAGNDRSPLLPASRIVDASSAAAAAPALAMGGVAAGGAAAAASLAASAGGTVADYAAEPPGQRDREAISKVADLVSPSESGSAPSGQLQELAPATRQALCPDPRENAAFEGGDIGIVAFSRGERVEPCDKLCSASFLGNFYDLGPAGLTVAIPVGTWWFSCCAYCHESQCFRNAEAAFHSLKFWEKRRAPEFESLTGSQAVSMSEKFADQEDRKMAGLSNPFLAMLHVLRAKFARDSDLAAALMKTSPDFLLHHGAFKGDDPVWSDDFDGTGHNWLGLQLMLIRDELAWLGFPGVSADEWTPFIERCLDTKTGAPLTSKGAKLWQGAIANASLAVRKAVSPVAAQPTMLPTMPQLPAWGGFCQGCKQSKDQCVVQ